MKKKRKTFYEDDGEDSYEGSARALPTSDNDDGKESRYLSFVRQEAKGYGISQSDVVVPSSNQTVFITESLARIFSPLSCLDDHESLWISSFDLEFAKFALSLKHFPSDNIEPDTRVPRNNEIKEWKKFLFANVPFVSTIRQMDFVTCCALVGFVRTWLVEEDEEQLSKDQWTLLCCWLFALFCVLEEPFDSDTSSDIQAVCRKLNQLNEEENCKEQRKEEWISRRIVLFSARKFQSLNIWYNKGNRL